MHMSYKFLDTFWAVYSATARLIKNARILKTILMYTLTFNYSEQATHAKEKEHKETILNLRKA